MECLRCVHECWAALEAGGFALVCPLGEDAAAELHAIRTLCSGGDETTTKGKKAKKGGNKKQQ